MIPRPSPAGFGSPTMSNLEIVLEDIERKERWGGVRGCSGHSSRGRNW